MSPKVLQIPLEDHSFAQFRQLTIDLKSYLIQFVLNDNTKNGKMKLSINNPDQINFDFSLVSLELCSKANYRGLYLMDDPPKGKLRTDMRFLGWNGTQEGVEIVLKNQGFIDWQRTAPVLNEEKEDDVFDRLPEVGLDTVAKKLNSGAGQYEDVEGPRQANIPRATPNPMQ